MTTKRTKPKSLAEMLATYYSKPKNIGILFDIGPETRAVIFDSAAGRQALWRAKASKLRTQALRELSGCNQS